MVTTPQQPLQAAPLSGRLPVFPLRDTVVYPAVPAQLSSTRPHTIHLVTEAFEAERPMALITARRPVEVPAPDDLYAVGTAALVQRMWHLPDGSIRLLVQGQHRIDVAEITADERGLFVRAKRRPTLRTKPKALQGQAQGASGLFQQILSLTPHLPDELQIAALNIDDPGRLADFIAFHLNLDLAEKQAVLEEPDPAVRLRFLSRRMGEELEVLKLGARVRTQVQSKLDRSRRDHLIREQIKVLQRELGEDDPRAVEVAALRTRLDRANPPPETRAEAQRELGRLMRLPIDAAEYATARTYLDWLIDLPWNRQSEEHLDVQNARRVLDRAHCGLDDVKERILDDLAVRQLGAGQKAPVLCLVGPPGVGKTSLGRSIARALNRRFVRVALGGVRDEAELRGHRRTYVGAMPGRVIQGIHRSGARNPVLMFDEIDKLGTGGLGDPASALLEILDPEQNAAFLDHYLNVPFDLSRVLFVATANVLSGIPDALRDRLEVIAVPGYLETEKAAIVRRHILPQQRTAHGLSAKQVVLKPAAVRRIIGQYTREPGLRELIRTIGTVCRKAARNVAEGRANGQVVEAVDLETYLGPPPYASDDDISITNPGMAIGLAATPFGGQTFRVEAATMSGRGELTLTGRLGDMMKESALAALSYVRSRGDVHGVEVKSQANADIHVHIPAGAVPKDGPSAGLTLAVCLASLFIHRPVAQRLGFSGEITLSGRILRVGAIRDKVLAAQRAGLRRVVLPEGNRPEVEALPAAARRGLNFCFANTIDDAFRIAFDRKPKRV